ncbi:ESX secretion-associated protein EspG [Saccharothrix longispora]|uniref:ESX secretion-associated protein EspG n=1 Tax=Saccharothrix longispora TaxID=33920 RepID=UPI0028FD76E9|nr:ESX secretion-associated protein EspG [Saccharothrix longispora]MBY8851848.1 ESX secretion-associated protein EspG [Saccharothrix sp. MB29]MDU0291863.1 ESX secretion-associated protein EspG [Saccharothrix longispora]
MTNATLSATAFRTAWEHLDLGAMPIVLHVQDDPAPWSHLTAQGLARGGELDPWLGAAFKLLAYPPRSVDLRLGIGSTAVRALAASTGTGSLLAVLRGDLLSVREAGHDLATALVGLLPRQPDGTVGASDLRGRFGAAAIDRTGRRHRATDVVDFHGPVDAGGLRRRIAGLLDEFRE